MGQIWMQVKCRYLHVGGVVWNLALLSGCRYVQCVVRVTELYFHEEDSFIIKFLF